MQAKTEDDTTLKSVLDDLRAKEEELKQAVEEMKKQKETIQAAFQKAFGPSLGGNKEGGRGEEGGTSKVVDLGTVGQGRRRINLAPVQNTASIALLYYKISSLDFVIYKSLTVYLDWSSHFARLKQGIGIFIFQINKGVL